MGKIIFIQYIKNSYMTAIEKKKGKKKYKKKGGRTER